jgi:hypothetical protein
MLPYSRTEIPEYRTGNLRVYSPWTSPSYRTVANAIEEKYPIDAPSGMVVKGVGNWFPSSF